MKRFSRIRHYPIVISLRATNGRFSMGDLQPLVSDELGIPKEEPYRRGEGWALRATGASNTRLRRFRETWTFRREGPGFDLATLIRSAIRLYDSGIVMQRDFPVSDDQALIQIVDSALADVTHRSGEWLVCRQGCTQCCVGAFPINQLDAARLRNGLAELEFSAPARAEAVRARARDAVARLSPDFPGDPASGLLDEGDAAAQRFSDFANDETCPVLDPATGACELYESRPITCRVFGPPVRSEDGLGVCELCFQGATDKEIAACEMKPDPEDIEAALLKKLEKATGVQGNTIVAFCLAS